MSLSELCIRRPVATTLLSIGAVLAGLFAYQFIPVAALPRADFPTINVSASLAGASPQTMATSVATPLIKQLQTIAGVDTISASSRQGSTSITVEFDLDRDIDKAAADVQAAITRATRQLPDDMTNPPSYRKVNPADAPVLLLAVQAPSMPLYKLDDWAESVISPRLSTLTGVAQVQVYGAQTYAVRIRVDPDRLVARGLTLDEVATAIRNANNNSPVGSLSNPSQTMVIEAPTQRRNAAEFSELIIATRDQKPIRLQDIARVEDSVENEKTASWYDGTRSIVLAVQRQPDANTVAVVDAIYAALPDLKAELPPDIRFNVLNDRSTSIREAVADVKFTLGLTIALVVMVIFLFLRRLSATLIPALAVPISLIATLGGMYLLGYSIDNVSLLALTLSVGLVVDDAIVMLENIVRHVENGMRPFEAALKGSREVAGTIISMTLSLVAVFLPVLLMGGVVGRLFNEFGVVVTMALLASAVVSLTLTPMMSARLPAARDPHAKPRGITGLFERGFEATLRAYDRSVGWCLAHRAFVLMVFFGTVLATAWMMITIPKGFFPEEDIGQLSVNVEARQDIGFPKMVELQKQAEAVLRASPYVAHVATVAGGGFAGGSNSGSFFVELKRRDQRPELATVLRDLRGSLAEVPGLRIFVSPVQNLRLGGRSSRSAYQLVVQSIDQEAIADAVGKLSGAMTADRAHFQDVATDLEASAATARVVIDRAKAEALGIPSSVIRTALQSGFGTSSVATIYATGNAYDVILEFDPSIPWSIERMERVRIRSGNGALVPLASIATIERTASRLSVNQNGLLMAVTISFNLPEGVSLGQASERVNQIRAELGLPPTVSVAFAGTAKVFEQALSNQLLLLAAAIATIYVVLGVLYESYIHPLTILSGIPSAAVGALAALELFGMDLSMIAVIGLLMLIGIVKKNAIMMVDVALHLQREENLPPAEAMRRACAMRYRPIMMTTFAALLGALPIAVGHGASAELRQPLGITVVGGLIVSQMVTLFITPVIYAEFERLAAGSRTLLARLRRRPAPAERPALGEAVQPAE